MRIVTSGENKLIKPEQVAALYPLPQLAQIVMPDPVLADDHSLYRADAQ